MKAAWHCIGLLIFLLTGCGPSDAEKKERLIAEGMKLFNEVVDKSYACSDCHMTGKTPLIPDRIYAGHPLDHVANRKNLWADRIRGKNENLINAALYCRARFQTLELEDLEQKFQGEPDGVNPSSLLDDSSKHALTAFLTSLTSPTKARPRYSFPYDRQDRASSKKYFTTLRSIAPDESRGRAVYENACKWCHGENGVGKKGKSKRIKVGPADIQEVYEKVRGGGFRMPFFQTDLLSDQDLVNVAHYVVNFNN